MSALHPRPGDIGCTRTWSGRHTCFMYLGFGRIIEADPAGARITALTAYDWRAVSWLSCPEILRPAVAAAARALEGTPHSFVDHLALAAHRLRLPIPGLRDYIASGRRLTGGQLVDFAAQRGGWLLIGDGRWDGAITASEIAALSTPQRTGAR